MLISTLLGVKLPMLSFGTISLRYIGSQNPWTNKLLAVYFSSFLCSAFICNFSDILTSSVSKSQEQQNICTDNSLAFTRFLWSQLLWWSIFPSSSFSLLFCYLFIYFYQDLKFYLFLPFSTKISTKWKPPSQKL